LPLCSRSVLTLHFRFRSASRRLLFIGWTGNFALDNLLEANRVDWTPPDTEGRKMVEMGNFLGSINNRTASKRAFWARVAAALPNSDTDLELCQRRALRCCRRGGLLPFFPP